MGPVIDIMIPTVDGREDHLERCLRTYRARTSWPIGQIVVVRNRDCVGAGWNDAAASVPVGERAQYVHFTNDDIEPESGWDQVAVSTALSRSIPAPALLEADGRFHPYHAVTERTADWTEVVTSTIHFMPWSLWDEVGPCLPVHYYSDDYLSWRARRLGWPSVYRSGYRFRHHWAQVRRGAGMSEAARMDHDRVIYNKATGESR